MITEDYVSFETAKLLKEKGFDELSTVFYNSEGNDEITLFDYEPLRNSDIDGYAKVTHQMAMKWLREACGLIISIEFQAICSTWKWRIYIKSSNKKHTDFQHYNKYEEACEAAIEYCLINLV